VKLSIKAEKTNDWVAEDMPLNIVFEDADIIIINKPVGLVTHPGAGNWTGTLANALLYYDPALANLDRAGIVHRLDKNTSGLMVVASSELAQKNLVEQLQTHSVSRPAPGCVTKPTGLLIIIISASSNTIFNGISSATQSLVFSALILSFTISPPNTFSLGLKVFPLINALPNLTHAVILERE
jgi:hypothetical protein